jgi:FKBP-type peptidyl-prolyl cis-trans isomerase
MLEENLLDEGRRLIEGIEGREQRRSTTDTSSLDEINDDLEKKADVRRAERNEKLNQWEKNAQEEKEYRNAITNNMTTLTTFLKENQETTKTLTTTLINYLAFKMGGAPQPPQPPTPSSDQPNPL